MTKQDDVQKLREQAKRTAKKVLNERIGFPISPRKAMSRANKVSKSLAYPISPFPKANPLQLFQWAAAEWANLRSWKALAAPVIAWVALSTYGKEKATIEARQAQIDKAQAKRVAASLYGVGEKASARRKLLGIIPMPGGRA